MGESFNSYAEKYGLEMSDRQASKLTEYMERLLKINEQINLTAIRDETAFIDKHLIDSCICDLSKIKDGSSVLDVGTGGGFPGIPLAIRYPNLKFVLLDATEKKIKAIQKIAQEIGVENASFLVGRAEELAKKKENREKYDVVVSRGVADYAVLCELCLPFLKNGGIFYAWKGKRYKEEIKQADKAVKILKSKIEDVKKHILLKTDEEHVIIQCRKTDCIDIKYPRNYGAIKKKPL